MGFHSVELLNCATRAAAREAEEEEIWEKETFYLLNQARQGNNIYEGHFKNCEKQYPTHLWWRC